MLSWAEVVDLASITATTQAAIGNDEEVTQSAANNGARAFHGLMESGGIPLGDGL